ncbi:MAG: hypothetical protein J6T56_09095 [Bacteroidales bacterium]|nr:hypothetical protein [Bacteroidales bacterium]MBP5613750.1 hypothetical protein [Bacteroidales bacterium]
MRTQRENRWRKIVPPMLLLCLLAACGQKKGEILEPPVIQEPPCSIYCDGQPSDSLPVLPDVLQNQLYRYLKHVTGTGIRLKAPLPESWRIESGIESPSPDYDIWIVSGGDDAQYKMLLTVTVPEKEGEAELVSALLVAYSCANEEVHRIESEEWYAEVAEDYTVTVHKKYESLHSLADTLSATHSNVETETRELFRLDLTDGRFIYQEPEYNEPYRAVIQFADTAGTSLLADSLWIANAMTMQEALEPENVYFMEIFSGFEHVMVTNYMGELVDEVDLSDFLKTYSRGYIILEKGKKPRYLRYCPASDAVEKIFGLWGLEYNPADEDVISCDA